MVPSQPSEGLTQSGCCQHTCTLMVIRAFAIGTCCAPTHAGLLAATQSLNSCEKGMSCGGAPPAMLLLLPAVVAAAASEALMRVMLPSS